MEHADDETIWSVAKAQGFAVVTKDSDFYEKSLLRGFPPQVIWLKCGNVGSRHVEQLVLENEALIRTFISEQGAACLEIY